MKKIIGIVGSPRKQGNCAFLTEEVLKSAESSGMGTELFYLNDMNFKGCQGCFACRKTGSCVQEDELSPLYDKIIGADGIVFSSPLYMWSVTGQAKLFLDRMLPLIGDHFKPRNAVKPAVLIFSQGYHRPEKFQGYFKEFQKLIKIMGFNTIGTLISLNGDDLNTSKKNNQLIQEAERLGKLF